MTIPDSVSTGGGIGGLSAAWLTNLAETTLLVAYCTFVPMMLAVGLYFPLWYTLRQTARTRAVASHDPAPDRLSLPRTWAAMVIGALVTFGLMAGLYALVPPPLGGAGLLGGAVAFYTVFVCILALPHIVVGEWLNRARGIWHVPRLRDILRFFSLPLPFKLTLRSHGPRLDHPPRLHHLRRGPHVRGRGAGRRGAYSHRPLVVGRRASRRGPVGHRRHPAVPSRPAPAGRSSQRDSGLTRAPPVLFSLPTHPPH